MSDYISDRERFEAWASSHYVLCEQDMAFSSEAYDEYMEPDIQLAYEAWQAAKRDMKPPQPDKTLTTPGVDWIQEP